MWENRRRAAQRGLTLIEVMVALGVLVILVGGIFLVVQTSLKTVLMIDATSSRNDELTNLTDILRVGFRNLPARARLTAGPVRAEGVNQHLVMVRNAPGFLSWLATPEADETIVLLSFRQDAKTGLWRACLKRFPAPSNLSRDVFDPKTVLRAGSGVPWLDLVGDFQSVTPRFFDAASGKWLDRWDDSRQRPALIELKLVTEVVRDERSETTVLWVPPVRGDAA